MKVLSKTILGTLLGASVCMAVPAVVQADGYDNGRVEIFFTRHAEKKTVLKEVPADSGNFIEDCGEDKCAEELNAAGELRAELLADWFYFKGITHRLTHAFSSHKTRTRQTIMPIVTEAKAYGNLVTTDIDITSGDGIQQYPVKDPDNMNNYATELAPEGTSDSEMPTIDALLSLPAGSVALVSGHSGTLYDIMAGLGLDDVCVEANIQEGDTLPTCNADRYPFKESNLKVKDFGDVWRIVIRDGGVPMGGVTRFKYRQNLTFGKLIRNNIAR